MFIFHNGFEMSPKVLATDVCSESCITFICFTGYASNMTQGMALSAYESVDQSCSPLVHIEVPT